MRTALIIRFDGLGRESVAFFTDPTAAKIAFKSASFADGGLELWTSSKGRIKRKAFAKGHATEEPVPVEAPPEPEPVKPEPAPEPAPVAESKPEPAAPAPAPIPAAKPQTARRGWRR